MSGDAKVVRGPAVLQPLQQSQEAAHLPPVRGGGAGGREGSPRPGRRPRPPPEPQAWRAGGGDAGAAARSLGGPRACGQALRGGAAARGPARSQPGKPGAASAAWARGETVGEAE